MKICMILIFVLPFFPGRRLCPSFYGVVAPEWSLVSFEKHPQQEQQQAK